MCLKDRSEFFNWIKDKYEPSDLVSFMGMDIEEFIDNNAEEILGCHALTALFYEETE